ncbi:hypothetical protein [Plantactinospora sp. KLBMP9567]|uniref:hypothetical protein n=1 Tax=Plantactinospora sp. KLBMP9567 TaxID=3085900 RepID=UPI002982466E|nr:hypothetical protein [Plantactinospora sp. KLBMP9567]MDW5328550.1 hypothetical protein [Plantactinospora sp. KLBMP9567]
MEKEKARVKRHQQDGPSILTKLRVALSIIVVAGVALQGCGEPQHLPPSSRPTEAPLIEKHAPSSGKPVRLEHEIQGWETFAWLSERLLCVMAARPVQLRRPGQENEHTYCDRAPDTLLRDGPPALSSKPLPQVAPMDPDSRRLLLVGTVRGTVATVDVSMFGVTVTGEVRQLPTGDHRQIGAYAVWLPRSGPETHGMTLSDITAVVARDHAGRVVAELP